MNNESIMLLLKSTNKKILNMLANRYREMKLNITPIQSKVLMCIYENNEVSSNDIGKRIHVNKSALSKMLNNLEKNGYISRENSKEDTRKKIVKLTNKSKDIVRILENDAKEVNRLLMIGINMEEYDSFKSVLDKVEMNIERMRL